MEPSTRDLEKSSLKAWPALEEHLYDGWVLKFSGGYTKRANSVNVLDKSTIDLVEKVLYCERIYHDRGLPTIFRITPLSPPDLDGLLKERDYKMLDPTNVMIKDIQPMNLPLAQKSTMKIHDLDSWLEIFEGLRGKPNKNGSIHRKIIQSIKGPCLFASTGDQGVIKSCGLGVLNGAYFGFFDIITHPSYRRQGFGSALVGHMMGWARENGAGMSYLQVMESNGPGLSLYQKLGFNHAYQYWYRMP